MNTHVLNVETDLSQSRFLSKNDVDQSGILLTIDHVEYANVASEGEPAVHKWMVHWRQDLKPMVLNKTNGSLIAAVTGSKTSDRWSGKSVVVYYDPTIMFKGELKGGLRIRTPTQADVVPTSGLQSSPNTPRDDTIHLQQT
jgi:hypothetical protein